MLYDFGWVTDEMIEEVACAEEREETLERYCDRCPYREYCGEKGVFLGCILWEEYMGEEL